MTKTLLLADDSVVIQKLVGLSFANEPVELVTTDNGEDALLRARECKPDVILADVVMPGRSGYEVCEEIKRDPELRDIPVLLLTGTFEAFDEQRAAQVGSSGHITKPFEAQVLVDRVNQLLEQAPAREAPAASPPPTKPVADEAYEFFDETPKPIAAAPIADTATVPVATPSPAADPDPNENSFSFDNDAADIEPLSASDSLDHPAASTTAQEEEQGGDRTVAMMPGDPNVATPSPSTTMDFDELGATVLSDSQSGISEPKAISEPEMLEPADPGATRIVNDPFDDDEPDLSFHEEAGDPSISGIVDFGSASDANLFASGDIDPGDTLLADDLFGETGSGFSQSAATDPHEAVTPAPTPAPALEDLDGDEEPVLESSQPGIEAIDEDTAIDEATALAAAPTQEPDDEFDNERPMGVSDSMELRDPTSADKSPSDASEEPDTTFTQPDPIPHAEPIEASESSADAQPFAKSESTSSSITPLAPDLSPMLRERLHESLEKIAWEAFADLSDQIVKQALQRVEAIAWEVIPQMAEALIQEEIRRMKGEGEDE